jgi:hypothetical protein
LLATHTDAEGHLWGSTMRHAGVVYPEPSGVVARGEKLQVGSKNVDRGDIYRLLGGVVLRRSGQGRQRGSCRPRGAGRRHSQELDRREPRFLPGD